MRIAFALLAVAGCATPTTRHSQYETMLGELRRDDRARPGAIAAAVTGPALDRRALVEAAVAANRDVEAMRQAFRAAVEAVPAATAFDDPMASYTLAPLSIGAVRFGQRIALSQKLPYPGKRQYAGDIAVAEAEAARGDLHAMELAVAELASQLYDEAFLAARALEINTHHKKLIEQLRTVAAARVASGRGSTQDALQAEVELGLLDRERLSLEASQVSIAARINGLLHRDPSAPLPPPVPELAVPAAPASVGTLEREAVEHRPTKAIAEARLAGAEATVRGAERAFYPDVAVSAMYDGMAPMPQHRWMLGLAIDIPLQRGKRSAEVASARARVAQARAEIERTGDDIRVEVTVARRELVEALAAVELYDTRLVPAARAQVDAALAGFMTAQNDFTAVILAERALRDIELAAFRARALAWHGRAALDRAIGRIDGGTR